jgi:nuclease S1
MTTAHPNSLSRRLWLVVALVLMVANQTAPPAWAWGPLGHRVIARLAERHLTPATKAALSALLEPGESLADASVWADEHVRELRTTAHWHYVDVPLDEPRYDAKFSGDDPKKGCVVDKINELRRVVNDKTKTVQERRFALRFLIHCIEDLHMPLHVGDNHDRGGNDTQVRWFDEGSNMHRVWDSGIMEKSGSTEDYWAAALAQLDTAPNRAAWMKGTVEEWATESLLAARAAYVIPETDERIKSGQKLSGEYLARHGPVVRRRLCQAGLRLAWVLNEAFGERASQ